MNTTETVNRIFELATNKGFKKKYLCAQLGVRPPLSAYPNPLLYGERYSFKQEDTPYHNGRECLSVVRM